MQDLFDNFYSKVVGDLKGSIKKGTKPSIASACFSIYAFEEHKVQYQSNDELRFFFTTLSFQKDEEPKQRREFYIPRIDRECALFGSQFDVKLRVQLSPMATAQEFTEWIKEEDRFKSKVTSADMLGFINIKNDKPASYTPENRFALTEHGCEKGNHILNSVNKTHTEI